MATLKEDIKAQSDWIVKAFAEDGFKLDHTMESLIEIDRFFVANMRNGKAKRGGRLYGRGLGGKLFSIGAYVGETIIKNVQGAEWITDDNEPEGELNVLLRLPNSEQIWPIQKVMMRFKNGSEDTIYPYIHMLTSEYTNQEFKDEFWALTAEQVEPEANKPWWRVW